MPLGDGLALLRHHLQPVAATDRVHVPAAVAHREAPDHLVASDPTQTRTNTTSQNMIHLCACLSDFGVELGPTRRHRPPACTLRGIN